MLVSLTAPKLCAKNIFGPHHFLGGRFVPPTIVQKFKLQLPSFTGTSMCVWIGKPPKIDISSLRQNYISPELLEDQVEADPFDQFQKLFDDAVAANLKEPYAMCLSTAGSDRTLLVQGTYKNQLLLLAADLGKRFLLALIPNRTSTTLGGMNSGGCFSQLTLLLRSILDMDHGCGSGLARSALAYRMTAPLPKRIRSRVKKKHLVQEWFQKMILGGASIFQT